MSAPARLLAPTRALIARNGGAVFLLVAALAVAGVMSSPHFLEPNEIVGTLLNVALLGIAAIGVSFVTYSGHYADLSIPAIMAVAGTVAVGALKWGLAASLACGIGAGTAFGLVNGFAVGYLRTNPIIWTLATSSIGCGVIRWAFSNRQAYPDVDLPAGKAFVELYGAKFLGVIPLTLIVFAALLIAGQWMLSATTFGAKLRLTGAAITVAKMTGADTRRLTAAAFVLSALTASIAGILLTSMSQACSSSIGVGYDFEAVTAVVIGGVSLAGGRGNVVGVLGGVLAIGLMDKVMSLNGIDTFTQQAVRGCVFIVVVGLGALTARRAGRDDA